MQIDQLKEKIKEFKRLELKLADPEILANQNEYRKLTVEYSNMKPVIENIEKLITISDQIEENIEIAKSADQELKQMAITEKSELEEEQQVLIKSIMIQMLPEDPNDSSDIIFEIRAGTGGEEAALFVSDLFRMYKRYAESNNFKVEVIDYHQTELGGYKEMIFGIKGNKPFKLFKLESGTHRVQRVPSTESNGRIHTSAVTVAVLPEVENVEVDISEKDLKIDIFHASGAGGQNVNNVATAVRMTHIPTGIVVSCQDERSQHKNKEKAKRILKARLYDKQITEQKNSISKYRKDQIGSGDRSQRIRTYNFPESRITDHRINLTLYRLEDIMNGNLDLILIPLHEADNKIQMENVFGKDSLGQ